MSASREKKQRKSDPENLTQKQRKERQEQQAAKRKTVLYTVIGVIAAAAVAVLLLWHNGVFESKAPAAVINGQEFSAEDLSYYYWTAVNQEYSTYAQLAIYGITMPFDLSSPLSEQVYDSATGKTFQEYFQDQALESLRYVTAVCDAANAAGYTLSAEGQAAIDSSLKTIDLYSAQNGLTRASFLIRSYGDGMTEKIYLRNLTNSVLASDYQNFYVSSLTYTDEEVQAYYDENADALDSYDYRYFYIDGSASNPTDADGNALIDEDGNTVVASEEDVAAALAAAKEKADEAAAAIRASRNREQAFIDAAPDYVSETSKANYEEDPDYSLRAGEVGGSLTGYYADWLKESGRKAGDVDVVEASSGYYVVLFLDRYLVEDPTVGYQTYLFNAALDQEDDPATEDVNEANTPSQAAMDAAKASAEALLSQWQAGEATTDSFAALAGGSDATYNTYSYVQQGDVSGELGEWLFDSARQGGETTLIEVADSGWRLVYFTGQQEPYWNYTAANALRQDDQTEWLQAITADYEATAGDGMAKVGR